MDGVVADTHAVVWYIVEPQRLSAKAVAAFEGATSLGKPIYVSSISIVEITYLIEKGRLPETVMERLSAALGEADPSLVIVPLDLDIAYALRRVPRDVVPDMPDRIIAATALHLGLPLVTHDGQIQSSAIVTIW